MSQTFEIGDRVQWNWGEGTGTARVQEIFNERVTRTISGAEVTRNATEDEPAYLLQQEDGSRVLKSASELEPA